MQQAEQKCAHGSCCQAKTGRAAVAAERAATPPEFSPTAGHVEQAVATAAEAPAAAREEAREHAVKSLEQAELRGRPCSGAAKLGADTARARAPAARTSRCWRATPGWCEQAAQADDTGAPRGRESRRRPTRLRDLCCRHSVPEEPRLAVKRRNHRGRKPTKGASALASQTKLYCEKAHRPVVVRGAVAIARGIPVRRRVVVSRLRKERL